MFTRIPGVPLFRRLSANTRGRDFIVADVHGCYTLLQRLLDKVNFDPTKDRLFIAGDLVDRGPESIKALDWIYKPWVHVVAGNHDLMMLVAAHKGGDEFHEGNGGEWFVPVMREQPDLATEFTQVFEGLPIALEVECVDGRRFGIVHAECPHFDWNDFTHALEHEQNPSRLDNIVCSATQMRTRDELKDTTCVTGIDTIFVGHSLMDRTQLLGNTLYIDTWASSDKGRLTLVQMDNRQEWTLSRPELRAMRLLEQESASNYSP